MSNINDIAQHMDRLHHCGANVAGLNTHNSLILCSYVATLPQLLAALLFAVRATGRAVAAAVQAMRQAVDANQKKESWVPLVRVPSKGNREFNLPIAKCLRLRPYFFMHPLTRTGHIF